MTSFINKEGLLTIFVFLCLLITTAASQIHIKPTPQIEFFIFVLSTLFAFLLRQYKVASVLFYILLFVTFYIGYFVSLNFIIDTLFPYRNISVINGQKYVVMDTWWIWTVPISIILSALTLRYYHKRIKRNYIIEAMFCILLLVIITTAY